MKTMPGLEFSDQNNLKEYGEFMLTPALMVAISNGYRSMTLQFLWFTIGIEW